MSPPERKPLGPLEHEVMEILWARQRGTAENVRTALQGEQELRESTVRTVLTRLEAKGYLEHDIDGRTYVYRPTVKPENVASGEVRGIIDRLCRGSVENLLVGMVDDELITAERLRQLAERIAKAEKQHKRAKRKGR